MVKNFSLNPGETLDSSKNNFEDCFEANKTYAESLEKLNKVTERVPRFMRYIEKEKFNLLVMEKIEGDSLCCSKLDNEFLIR